jgi:hypothetical protein
MGSDGVVVAPPALDGDPRLGKRVEDFTVEQFVAKSGVEALDEAVLPRAGKPTRRCRQSTVSHRLVPSEPAAGWIDAAQAPGRSGAQTVSIRFEHGRCRRSGARGSAVSPCRLSRDHLVQRQIRDRPSKPGILRLQLLHPLDLIAPQRTLLLTSAVVGDLRDADGSDRLGHRLALR